MLKIIKTVFNTFVDWSNILNKPSIFPPSAHTQDISTINGLQAELDSKVEASEYDSKINQDVRISSAPTFKDIIIRETTTSDASLNIIEDTIIDSVHFYRAVAWQDDIDSSNHESSVVERLEHFCFL